MHLTNPRRPLKKLLCAMAAVVGIGSSLLASAADPLKVGFVYIGPIGDHGWTYQHEQGRQAMVKALGDKVISSYVENVPEGADAERVIRNMAKGGYDLIFSTSFGYMNPTLKVAKQFPKVKFEHATGYKQDKNMGTYLARTYEGRYVSGYIAAKMTKTKKIGYVASFPIPEVLRDIDAIQLALNKYNPGTEIKVVWVNSWFESGQGSRRRQRADRSARRRGLPAHRQPGADPDSRASWRVCRGLCFVAHFGPKAVLASIVNNWGPHYIQAAEGAIAGTWKPQDYWGGLKEGTVELPISDVVPADVKAEAQKIIASIESGEFHPFTGPIKDQNGTVKIADGVVATNAELASMNYYVEGIKAELPK